MTKDEKISLVLNNNGAFWAFSDKQFNEQKQKDIKYISLGAGLVCPQANAEKLIKEMESTTQEIKKEEKEKREARARELKIEKLPKAERINNRKILITEATDRVNNFMDSCEVVGHYKMLENSTDKNILEVIDSLLNTINSRYNDRAFETEVKEIYDINIQIIKELKTEILDIINK